MMLWQKIKITYRFFLRHKVTTCINLLGIVAGLTVSILLLLYVKKELETDQFHRNINQIYLFAGSNGRNQSVSKINLVKEYIPEIENITYFHGSWSAENLIKYNNKLFALEDVINADSAFFRVFHFNSLAGDIYHCLVRPNSIVLTQSEAKKIFGDEDALGKNVLLLSSEFDKEEYTVTAVIDDLPQNSSVYFKSVVSLSSLMQIGWYKRNAMHWGTHNYQAFALLNKNADKKKVEEKITGMINENAPEWAGRNEIYKLIPFNGLYFDKISRGGNIKAGKKDLVYLLGGIGILILIIACVNYFNLSVGQTEKRLKEVGVKKTLGASGRNLINQSLLETWLIFIAALLISIALIWFCLPFFNKITFSDFEFKKIFTSSDFVLILAVFSCSLFLFGLFPALILGRIKAINIFKGKIISSRSGLGFKNGLIIFQYVISIVLLVSTMMLYKQNQFMIHKDCGYEKENIAYFYLNKDVYDHIDILKAEFLKNTHIKNVALSSSVLGNIDSNWGLTLNNDGVKCHVNFKQIYVDENFMDLYGLKLIQGHGFNDNSSIREEVIFNKELTKKYNIKNIDNSRLEFDNNKGTVIGIAEDFNFDNVRVPIIPMGFICNKTECSVMSVKFASGNVAATRSAVDYMKKIWDTFSPDYPFEYKFMDRQYQSLYESELRFFKIFLVSSLLSVFIACLGLFGITYNVIAKKIKEIGIRKVTGAKIADIVTMLNKGFVINVIIALVIAIPITYHGLGKWLENYAYKTDISWWVFALAGIIALIVSLVTVSIQIWKAAGKNPVEALRYE